MQKNVHSIEVNAAFLRLSSFFCHLAAPDTRGEMADEFGDALCPAGAVFLRSEGRIGQTGEIICNGAEENFAGMQAAAHPFHDEAAPWTGRPASGRDSICRWLPVARCRMLGAIFVPRRPHKRKFDARGSLEQVMGLVASLPFQCCVCAVHRHSVKPMRRARQFAWQRVGFVLAHPSAMAAEGWASCGWAR